MYKIDSSRVENSSSSAQKLHIDSLLGLMMKILVRIMFLSLKIERKKVESSWYSNATVNGTILECHLAKNCIYKKPCKWIFGNGPGKMHKRRICTCTFGLYWKKKVNKYMGSVRRKKKFLMSRTDGQKKNEILDGPADSFRWLDVSFSAFDPTYNVKIYSSTLGYFYGIVTSIHVVNVNEG